MVDSVLVRNDNSEVMELDDFLSKYYRSSYYKYYRALCLNVNELLLFTLNFIM